MTILAVSAMIASMNKLYKIFIVKEGRKMIEFRDFSKYSSKSIGNSKKEIEEKFTLLNNNRRYGCD